MTSRLEEQNTRTERTPFRPNAVEQKNVDAMAFVGRFRHVSKTLPTNCNYFRPIIFQLRTRSTTAISSAVDEKTEPRLARDLVLNFDEPKQAFKSKSTWEIIRALTVFRLCTIDFFVENNKKVFSILFRRI